jgi:hypothetical protein
VNERIEKIKIFLAMPLDLSKSDYVNNGKTKSTGDVKCAYLIYEKEFETVNE